MKSYLKIPTLFFFISMPYSIALADIGDLGTQNFMSYLQNSTSQIISNSFSNDYSEDSADATTSASNSDQDGFSPNYTPSKSRTRSNLQNFVSKTRAQNPAQADRMTELFASTDVIGQIGGAMQSVGLNQSNAADAFALYWVSAWQASVGDTAAMNSQTYQAVAAQAARGLSLSSDFGQASDAQKQELAEAMMVQAALIAAHMDDAAGDPAKLKAIAKAATQGAAASGLELGKMTLTEEGFRQKVSK